MADDLPERIRRGDLAALTDPAFELHLLAEGPGAAWWQEGRLWACRSLAVELAQALPAGRLLGCLDAWASACRYQPEGASGERWRLLRAELARLPPGAAGAVLVMPADYGAHAALDLARRLRAQLPSAAAELDAALSLLERYVV